jgi:dipeptidyl aminopeptidase/acylaminoacyl peptidase
MRCLAVALLALFLPPGADAGERRPVQIDDLFRFKRVADPQISPDGKMVVYVLTTVNVDKNSSLAHLWLTPTTGGEPRQLTNAAKSDSHPRWSPDGKRILFESSRSGSHQLWIIGVDGGEARQLTTISTGAGEAQWSRDGKQIAFVSAVYPEYSAKPYKESDALNKKRMDEIDKSPVKAKVFTRLFFRHWDEYVGDKRQHLFVMDFDPATEKVGEPRDVTPGDRDANPTSSTFSMGDDFTFSPDGKYLLFTAVPANNEAWSTNYDICRVPVTGGSEKWENLTKSNPAADSAPRFSPDGTKLAYRAQKQPGFEADLWTLLVVDVNPSGTFRGFRLPFTLTAPGTRETPGSGLAVSIDEFAWATTLIKGESEAFLVTADFRGTRGLALMFSAKQSPDGFIRSSIFLNMFGEQPKSRFAGTSGSLSVSRDGKNCAVSMSKMDAPAEVYRYRVLDKEKPALVQLTYHNEPLLRELNLPQPESVTLPGAGGTPMQMWLLKPPGFDANKKWPLAFLVHGGPQGAWNDGWSYRWNPELWAAQGYVVALPNPRGSTGFGQKYVDEISGDWGGKCYEDLMAGLAWLEKQPYIDTERMAAAGASFGGYMMNWFQGHTTKFKTLITHCGVYNFDSMYALTEELWFDEWEHGGPPWLNRHSYEKHSPHRFAKNFKTPMLIIHNDLDFRVPVAEGLQLFTTLQRLGVPSRMINFPDEGHWVLKPANSRYWHREVFRWLAKYAPPGGR